MQASVFIVNESKQYTLQLKKFIESSKNLRFIGAENSVENGIEQILIIKPDIILIEVEFSVKSGFNIAETVQMFKLNPAIIFTSSSEEFAFKALPFRPFDYLVRPVNLSKFKAAIYKIISQLNDISSTRVTITRRSIDTFINVDDILYCESIRRGVNVFFDNNTFVKININIDKFYPQLFHKKFFRSHRGFIINLDHLVGIDKVETNAILMKNGQKTAIDISLENIKYLQKLYK